MLIDICIFSWFKRATASNIFLRILAYFTSKPASARSFTEEETLCTVYVRIAFAIDREKYFYSCFRMDIRTDTRLKMSYLLLPPFAYYNPQYARICSSTYFRSFGIFSSGNISAGDLAVVYPSLCVTK